MKIVRLSVEQPITVTVGIILVLLAGFIALDRIPIQMTPEIENVVISVTTTWENASPREVETEIVDEQEERLQSVENLQTMTSISQSGQGQIRLEFRTGTNKEAAMREVSDKLREVPSYPPNVDEPVIEDSDPESRDYIAWLTLSCSDPNVDVATLFDVIENRVQPPFERLPGVAEVGVLGGREREVQIRVDPVSLAQRDISTSEFIDALRATNENFSAGALAEGKSDIRLRAIGRFSSPEQVMNTVIRKPPSGPVYVRDVAEVVETFKETTSFVRSRGEPVIAINFQREIGSNVIEVMGGVKAEIERMGRPGGLLDAIEETEGINGDLEFNLSYDQTQYIDQALNLVRNNIFLGGSIAFVVLILFLRSFRSVCILGLSIPISVIGSVVAMVAMGRTVNVVSLAGMAFAVGMVVDNSIVVLENIYRHLEMGKKAAKAAVDGAAEVAGAVLASTLTTLIVFVPILLIEETAGQLFRDIALAICAAVALSFLVSITVIPSAAALLLGSRRLRRLEKKSAGQASRGRLGRLLAPLRIAGKTPALMRDAFLWVCRGYVLRLAIVFLFIALPLLGAYWLLPPIDYLPSGNRNIVFGSLIPPPGYNIEQLSELGDRIEDRIRPWWEAAPGYEKSPESNGGGDGRHPVPVPFDPALESVVPPPLGNYFLVARPGQMFHGAISADEKRVADLVPLLQYATSDEVTPGVIAFAFQLPLFRIAGNTGAAVKIDLTGPNLDDISDAAGMIFGRLGQKYGFNSVQPEPPNFNIPSPEMQVLPDLIALTELDLTVNDLGLAVQVNGDGAFAGEYEVDGELIDLKVVSGNSLGQTSLGALRDIPLAVRGGSVVNLGGVSELVRVTEPDQIKRVGRQRAVTIQFTPPVGMPLQQAVEEIDTLVGGLRESRQIASSVDIDYAGSASKLEDMRRALLGDKTVQGTVTSSLFLALVVVYLLLCVLFQSWTNPLIIMLTVPLATFGGFLALAGVHVWSVADRYLPVQNLDVLSILGFIILAGIVVNNAILIVHQALNFMSDREESNNGNGPLEPNEAIAASMESRVRPIMMSTLTSVGGMLPLVIIPGAGSELYRGLGSVVTGGLVVSTVFTLVLIPVVLSLAYNAKRGLAKDSNGG